MKVLLVDDSKSARYALRLQLQRHGMLVDTADAAESALERIRNTPPDAVFMDHTMPGMNGFEALDIIKSTPSTEHIPVVMCTSNEDPDYVAQAEKKGAMAVLSKATAPEKLGDLLDRLQQDLAETGHETLAATAPSATAAPGLAEPSEVRDTLSDERLEELIRTLIGPLLEERTEQLRAELMAQMEERLASSLETETERLKQHLLDVQNEQSQQATSRLINETLPQALRQQLEQEKEDTTQKVNEVIGASMNALTDDESFLRRLSDAIGPKVNDGAKNVARRQATEVAERVATRRMDETASGLIQISKGSGGTMYLLAAGAALVGVASAAGVYFLLS